MKKAVLIAASIAAGCSAPQGSLTSTVVVEKEEAELFSVVYGDEFRIKKEGESYVLADIDASLEENLSQTIHQNRGVCGGFYSHDSMSAGLESFEHLEQNRKNESIFEIPIENSSPTTTMSSSVDPMQIKASIEKLSAYKTRYYQSETGVQSQLWLKQRWEELSSNLEGFTVATFTHSWAQPSIIATWVGTESPDEVIILGGHGDSIAQSLFSIGPVAPGADDNASGVSSITEVIRILALAGVSPRKTIKFMSYAAEEVGLKGSELIAKKFKDDNIQVKAVMQLDMTNHAGTDAGTIAFISDHTNANLNTYTKGLATTLEIPFVTDKCGYACSDHASWTKYGFASVFPFEAKYDDHNPQIHTKTDTLRNSDQNASHAAKFSQLAIAFLESLAF